MKSPEKEQKQPIEKKEQDILERFEKLSNTVLKNSHAPKNVNSSNVFQTANLVNLYYFQIIIQNLMQAKSDIMGVDHLKTFIEQVWQGKSGLILMEHFSNFDLPVFLELVRQKIGEKAAQSIVAVAGMKLNEENHFVRSFAEAYTRLLIYPGSTIVSLEKKLANQPEQMEKEYKKRQSINMASMRMMRHLKQTGHPILVFPSGTRYRPGEISTLKAIKEMDSYLRIFDTVVFVGLNGVLQSLEKKQGKMIHESVREDTIIASVSPIHSSLEYRERLREQKKKQDPQANEDQLRDYVCSHITESLKEQHQLGAQYYHQVCQQWPINHIDEYRPQNEQFFSL